MKAYISGPMSNLPEFNYPAFHAAAAQLRSEGLEVVNPAELTEPAEHLEWHHYMRADIKALMDCDVVYVLDGWHESKGARIEVNLAYDLGMKVYSFHWRDEIYRLGLSTALDNFGTVPS